MNHRDHEVHVNAAEGCWSLSAIENVEVPAVYSGMPPTAREAHHRDPRWNHHQRSRPAVFKPLNAIGERPVGG
ncbi:MAG: hypothetical protein WBQ37_15525 [Candidatus Competibacter sp.]